MSQIEYQAKNVPIRECFDYLSGNQGLSVRAIHNDKTQKNDCIVLSSSLQEETSLGYISKDTVLPNGRKLKLFENQEGIVVSRNGYAGSMSYLSPGTYTLTDHAYILFLKNECKYQIDLRWFILQYQKEIQTRFVTTSDGNQTWAITKFMSKFAFDIPVIADQLVMVKRLAALQRIRESLIAKRNTLLNVSIDAISVEDNKYVHKKVNEICDKCPADKTITKKKLNLQDSIYPVYAASIDTVFGYSDSYNNDEPAILAVNDGDAGRCYIVQDDKYCIGKHVTGLKPKKEYLSYLDLDYLRLAFEQEFISINKAYGVGNLPQTDMMNAIIRIPIDEKGRYDVDKQREISIRYKKIVKTIEIICERINDLVNVVPS